MIRIARCRCCRVNDSILSVNRFDPSVWAFPTSDKYCTIKGQTINDCQECKMREYTLCASSRITAFPELMSARLNSLRTISNNEQAVPGLMKLRGKQC